MATYSVDTLLHTVMLLPTRQRAVNLHNEVLDEVHKIEYTTDYYTKAPVAQWIEQPPPKGQVARSIRVRGAIKTITYVSARRKPPGRKCSVSAKIGHTAPNPL